MAGTETLFSPLRIRDLTLRNRVVMAPMTRECARDGIATAEMAAYYARRAAGGAGLIITEGVPPDLTGAFGRNVPQIFGAEAPEAWRAVVQAVHSHGAKIFLQLWHVGAFDPSIIGMADSFAVPPQRIGPSGLAAPNRPYGREMTQTDIDDAIASFGRAVATARAVGFDGVEIHGAHGYLPDQFLWAATNRRTDHYGGSLQNRARFACELLAECRRQAGPSFVLGYRLSQWKQLDYNARVATTPAELAVIVGLLADAGADLFHASTRRYWESAFDGSELSLAGWIKKLSGRPTIAVGSISLGTDFKAAAGKVHAAIEPAQIADVERRLAVQEFDLVALGRAMLANPNWVELVQSGRADQLRPFTKAFLESLR